MKKKSGVWKLIETERFSRGMTQKDVADILGVTNACYSMTTLRSTPLSERMLRRLIILFPQYRDELMAEYKEQRRERLERAMEGVEARLSA